MRAGMLGQPHGRACSGEVCGVRGCRLVQPAAVWVQRAPPPTHRIRRGPPTPAACQTRRGKRAPRPQFRAQVAAWLEARGLTDAVGCFADHGVDGVREVSFWTHPSSSGPNEFFPTVRNCNPHCQDLFFAVARARVTPPPSGTFRSGAEFVWAE